MPAPAYPHTPIQRATVRTTSTTRKTDVIGAIASYVKRGKSYLELYGQNRSYTTSKG